MNDTATAAHDAPPIPQRCATIEDLARVRERLAKVEGGHDNLRDGLNTLSVQFSDMRRDLTKSVADTAAQTRREIMERVDDMTDTATERNNEISGVWRGSKVA